MATKTTKNSLATRLVGGTDAPEPAPAAPSVKPQTLNGNAGSQSAAAADSTSQPIQGVKWTPPPPGTGKNVPYKTQTPGAIYDSQYWNNVMALNSQYGMEIAGLQTQQQQNFNAYQSESQRMDTDRKRSRRDLAESLLGRGNVYGGMHRRENTERDQDYQLNKNRLDADYTAKNQDILAQYADVQSRLAPETGTAWLDAAQEYEGRRQDQLAQQATEGAPDYGKSKKQRVKGMNKKINSMRAKAAKIEDEKKRKAYRKRIQSLRKKRDKLKG